MRILYLHQYFTTRAGAGGTRSYEFARRWVQAGHQVTLITGISARSDLRNAGRETPRRMIDGIDVLALDTPYAQRMSYGRRIVAFFDFVWRAWWAGIRHVGPCDVIYASSTPLTVGALGYALSLWKRVPFVFEIRDLWPEVPIALGVLRQPLLVAASRWGARFLYRVAKRVVTLAPGVTETLIQMGVPADKVVTIPNCSDLDIFRPQMPRPELVDRYGTAGQLVLVHAGAIGPSNGLTFVVETARVLQAREVHDIRFFLVGEGNERPNLERLAAQYKLRHLTFLASMPKLELAEFMPLANICLVIFAPNPIMALNSANKFFDALAAGRPVLINFGGWMQEVLERHQAGVAVTSHKPEDMADAILALRAHPERVAAMGRNARALAEREYDRDKLAQALAEVLQAVIDKTGGGRT